MLATDGTWHEVEGTGDNWRRALAPALVASIALLLAIGVLLFVRRLSGALEVPLAPIPLAVTATGLSHGRPPSACVFATAASPGCSPWSWDSLQSHVRIPAPGNRLAGVAGSIRGARADTGEA